MLVRLPQLTSLECPVTADFVACRLSSTDLFVVGTIAADLQLHTAVQVPDGFPGGNLFIRLRDDPAPVNAASLAAQILPAPATAPLPAGASPG